MKNRLLFIYWELRYRFLKWRWDRAAKHSVINGVALMYHHVTDDYVNTNESCRCTINEFKNAIKAIHREERQFVSIDEMVDIICNQRGKKFAVLTFDDVPDNFYYNAYPILNELKIPFVLFIATGFIDKPGYLTTSQINELDKDTLCTIGAHTMTHPMLRNVANSREELLESKRLLEVMIGHSVDYLAYPFGRQSSVSKRIMTEAKEIGYICAFGTIQSPISDTSSRNMYYIPRIVWK